MKSMEGVEGQDLADGPGAHSPDEHIDVVANPGMTLLTRSEKETSRPLEPPAKEAEPHRKRLVQLLESETEPAAEKGPDLDLSPNKPWLL